MQGLNEQDGFRAVKKPCGKSEQARFFELGLAIDLVEARVQAGLSTFFAELFSPFGKRHPASGRLPKAQRQTGLACFDEGLAPNMPSDMPSDVLSWRFEQDAGETGRQTGKKAGKNDTDIAFTEGDLLFLVLLADVLPTFTEMSEDIASNYVLSLTRDAFEDFEDFASGESGADESGDGSLDEYLDEVLKKFSTTTLILRDEKEVHEERLKILESVRGKGSRLELEVNPIALVALAGIAADAGFAEWLGLWDARGEAPSRGTLVLLNVLVSLLPLDEEDEDEMELSAREICAMLGVAKENMDEVPLERLCREIALLPGWSLESFEEIAEDADFEKGEVVWKIRRSLVD